MSNIKVLKFGATWCGPCKMLDPIMYELKDEYPNIEFQFVNVDEEPEITGQFGVMGIPRVMVYKNDEKVEDFTGFKPKTVIEQMINFHI
jgi:thioredoxin 1